MTKIVAGKRPRLAGGMFQHILEVERQAVLRSAIERIEETRIEATRDVNE
jgi:hypothetical protein